MTETRYEYTNHDRMQVDINHIDTTNSSCEPNKLDDTSQSHHHSTSELITLAQQRKCKLKFFRNQVAGHSALLWYVSI